jgi:NAD(P)-dependent dehydrogenase (short-subunit alcohol dehydrogenase family)
MDLGLRGKIALITGGSRGIGAGTARILSEEAAAVVICSRDEKRLQQTAGEISSATGNDVLPVRADLTKPDDIDRLLEAVIDRFGRIDILINNAGSSKFGYAEDLTDQDWVSGFELKFFSYVRLTNLVIPHMKRHGGGVIINVVGNAGRVPLTWHMPGGAANSALLNFTKTLSNQVGKHNIRINAVNPGPTETDRWDTVVDFHMSHDGISAEKVRDDLLKKVPLGRFSTVEDIGYAIAFLVSDKATHITGTSLTVDGGTTPIP